MFGFNSKKQEVNLRIDTCSSCGMFQKHAERSSKLIESWLDPKKFTLKTTINAGDPRHVAAFELCVNGQLVHSEQQRNHGYLDSHPDDEHKEAVRMAIQEIIAGNRAVMPIKQETSEIKLDKQRKQEHKDQIAIKKRELEDAQKSKHREEVLKKKAEADEKKQAQKEESKLKKLAAAKEKKQKSQRRNVEAEDKDKAEIWVDARTDGETEGEVQALAKDKKQKKEKTKRSAKDFRKEEAQKRKEELKEKAESAAIEAPKAQEEALALAKQRSSEKLMALEKTSREEAQKQNVQTEEKANTESLRVEPQAGGEREEEIQALAKELAARDTMTQRQCNPGSLRSTSISSAATLPFAAGAREAGHKILQTPRTTAGNSMNSSWEAPSETERKPLIQSALKQNSVASSQAAHAQPSTGLALLFGFACCRSSGTSDDSVGDIPAAYA